MQNDTSMGSQPREPKRNSPADKCRDCGQPIEPITLGPKFGSLGFCDFTAGRCEKCSDKFLEDYTAEQNRARSRQQEKQKATKSIELLGGIKPFEEFTFEKFKPELNPVAYDRAINFNNAVDNLFFYGKNRLGKTHLSIALAHRGLDIGKKVLVAAWPDLVTHLRRFESVGDFDGEERYIERIANLDIFVLDDLGLGAATDYVVKILWQILTRRMNRRKNGLVITSNLTLNDLNQKYGRKIPSRIFEMTGEKNLVFFKDQREKLEGLMASNFE